ncbi:unnamed protein product [Rotaria sordida]|uniref:TRC8-like N-terminal domain-containing protein n=2 Tax=Rotaria sordida TaxID=392033 RepID=A0A814C6N4_9BILA|nr:unnamed protein product [Rotaria sordida]
MDNDDEHVAGDIFLHSMTTDVTRRRTFFEHFQRFVPQQTIIYIQYCLLRIPFILIYDYLFTEKFSSVIEYILKYSIQSIDYHNHLILKPISYLLHSSLFHILLQIYLLLLIPILGLILLILLLLCSDRRLVIFYSYTISLLVIYFDYQMSYKTDIQSSSSINTYILQFLLSSIYIQMLNIRPRVRSFKIQTYVCHLAPFVLIVTRYLISTDYNKFILKFYYIIWTFIHLSELFICHQETIINIIYNRFLHDLYNLYGNFGLQTLINYLQTQTIINIIYNRFLHDLYNLYGNFGLQTLINYLQTRIHINTLLKIFWLTKIIVLPLGIRTIYTNPYISNINITNLNDNITLDDKQINYNVTLVKTIYFTSLFYGTETIFTLISLACLISHLMKSISHRLFRLLHLWTEDVEQIGTVVGVMFFLLLFQSNITRLDLNRRHVPLLKAFSLLIVALFHFLHTILEPQLLKVAMQTMTTRMVFDQTDDNQQENKEENRNNSSLYSSSILHSYHHRHVYTCISILFLVIFYIILLWRLTTFSTWLLAVTAFSLELIVRLLASLAQYTLYVLDAHNRLSNVESFDEYIFWIKAITSCFEFILGVFLLFNGFYILCYESRGALRALMLAIHAYLNIIKNLRRGWQIFRNRKSAWENVVKRHNKII